MLVSVSCCKSVSSDTFADEWESNKESIYKFIEAAHLGIKGVVLKDNGEPLQGEYIEAKDGDSGVTTSRGEYWLIQLPGVYEVSSLFPYRQYG